MTQIIYNSRNMSGGRFWEELKHCRSNPSIALSDVQSLLKRASCNFEIFANIILLAEEVSAGNINPLDLTLLISSETYLVAPNGDLCRAQPLGDDFDCLPLARIKAVITAKMPTTVGTVYTTVSWTSTDNSSR